MKQILILLICLTFTLLDSASAQNKLVPKFTWNQVDWEFPSEKVKQQLIDSGDYNIENALPVGIERYQDKLFVSVPRWKKGTCSGGCGGGNSICHI